MAYFSEEKYDAETTEKIAAHVREILKLLGEDTEREGLLKTPERVAKAMQFMTKGYAQDGVEIIKSAIFDEEYQQMVLIKDIELYSSCEHQVLARKKSIICPYSVLEGMILLLVSSSSEPDCERSESH